MTTPPGPFAVQRAWIVRDVNRYSTRARGRGAAYPQLTERAGVGAQGRGRRTHSSWRAGQLERLRRGCVRAGTVLRAEGADPEPEPGAASPAEGARDVLLGVDQAGQVETA